MPKIKQEDWEQHRKYLQQWEELESAWPGRFLVGAPDMQSFIHALRVQALMDQRDGYGTPDKLGEEYGGYKF